MLSSFHNQIWHKDKDTKKFLSYDWRWDKLNLLQAKLSEKKALFNKMITWKAYIQALWTFKVKIFPLYPSAESVLRDKLKSCETYKQIYSTVTEVLEWYDIWKKEKKQILWKLQDIYWIEKQKHNEELYPILLAIENIEATVYRKDKSNEFNNDDTLSKESSFILHYNEGNVVDIKVRPHYTYRNKFLLEYATVDPFIGKTIAHVPLFKLWMIKNLPEIKDIVIKAINDSRMNRADKNKVMEKISFE